MNDSFSQQCVASVLHIFANLFILIGHLPPLMQTTSKYIFIVKSQVSNGLLNRIMGRAQSTDYLCKFRHTSKLYDTTL